MEASKFYRLPQEPVCLQNKNYGIFKVCNSISPACTDVYVACDWDISLVSMEARRGPWILRNQSYRQLHATMGVMETRVLLNALNH